MKNLLHTLRSASVGACLLLAAPVALSGVQVIPPEPSIAEVPMATTDIDAHADDQFSFLIENAEARCLVSLSLTAVLSWPGQKDTDTGSEHMIACRGPEATLSVAKTPGASGTQELMITFCVTDGTYEGQLGEGTTIYLEAEGTACGTVTHLLEPQRS